MWYGPLCLAVVHAASLQPLRCESHLMPLRADVVPVIYGPLTPDAPRAFDPAPSARRFVFGGRILRPPRIALVRYCPGCRLTEEDLAAEALEPVPLPVSMPLDGALPSR